MRVKRRNANLALDVIAKVHAHIIVTTVNDHTILEYGRLDVLKHILVSNLHHDLGQDVSRLLVAFCTRLDVERRSLIDVLTDDSVHRRADNVKCQCGTFKRFKCFYVIFAPLIT